MEKLSLGVDIGGTNVKIGLVSHSGEVLEVHREKTKSLTSVASLFGFIGDVVNKYRPQVHAIGIGAPNVNDESGRIEKAPNLPWNTVPLMNLKTQFPELIVSSINDASAFTLGELLFGVGRKTSDFTVLTLGTGLGSGMVLKRKIWQGPLGTGPEAGHMVIQKEGRICGCGGVGHWEAYVGSPGILKTGRNCGVKVETVKDLREILNDTTSPFFDHAKKAWDKTGSYLACGIAGMVSSVGMDHFVISGGVVTGAGDWIKHIEDVVNRMVFKPFQGKIIVEASEMSPSDGGMIGASQLFRLKKFL